jgi:hypothetical protein
VTTTEPQTIPGRLLSLVDIPVSIPINSSRFTVAVHGGGAEGIFGSETVDIASSGARSIETVPTPALNIAQMMIDSGFKAGQDLDIFACQSGCTGAGQRLVNTLTALGYPPGKVRAPTGDLQTFSHQISDNGSFVVLPVPTI